MEAADLARWTRFAAKGGIGKCTALVDCVAESADDLMFLKDDEITVLMQLSDPQGLFLGYCEGVVGRFHGKNVKFHSKLKKPIMAKRSSVSSANIQPKSRTQSPLSQRDSPAPVVASARRTRRSVDGEVPPAVAPALSSSPPLSPSAGTPRSHGGPSTVPTRPDEVYASGLDSDPASPSSPFLAVPFSPLPSPHLVDAPSQPASPLSPSSPSLHSPPFPPLEAPMGAPSPPLQVSQVHHLSPSVAPRPFHLPPDLDLSPPKPLQPRSPPASPPSNQIYHRIAASIHSKSSSIASAYSQASTTVDEPEFQSHPLPPPIALAFPPPPGVPPEPSPRSVPPTAGPDTSTSTFFDTSRLSLSSSDGEVGIGLSLLQNLADNESGDDWSDSDADTPAVARQNTVRQKRGGSLRRRGSRKLGGSLKRKKSAQSTPKKRGSVSSGGSRYSSAGDGDDGDAPSGEDQLGYEDTEIGHGGHNVHERDTDDDLNGVLEADVTQTQEQFAGPYSVVSSRSASPEQMTFPPVAPLSPSRKHIETYVFPAPPTHTHRGSIASRRSVSSSYAQQSPMPDAERERRPSATSVGTKSTYGEDWEGDIYDDYRYSRFSVGATSIKTSAQRTSVGSKRVSSTSRTSVSSRGAANLRPRMGSLPTESTISAADLPNPFPASPPLPTQALARESLSSTGSGVQKLTRVRSGTNIGLGPPPPSKVDGGVGVLGSPEKGASGTKKKRKTSQDGSDSDGSVYTQESGGKASAGLPGSHPTSPSGTAFTASTPPSITMSPPPSSRAQLDSPPMLHRPAPLKLAEPSNPSTAGSIRSPLLHTTWNSPLPSPHDATSAVGGARGYTGTGEGFAQDGKAIPPSATFFGNATLSGGEALSRVLASAEKVKKGSSELENGDEQRVRRIVVEDDDDNVEVVLERSPSSSPRVGQEERIDATLSAVGRLPSPRPPLDIDKNVAPPASPPRLLPPAGLMPSSNLSPAPDTPPSPSRATPPPASHLRPSLHELRGGLPGQTSGERRSLFLPHPGAPKAANTNSPGPMYIAQQQPPAPQPPQVHGTARRAMELALAGHGMDVSRRGPTIYGHTATDLASAVGPMLITFSVDPPPATVAPHNATSPPPAPVPLPVPGVGLPQGRSSVGVGRIGSPANPPPERWSSVDQSAASGGVIPRANFFPKAGGIRPRSRSFSGFQSPHVEVPMPLQQRSHDAGSSMPSAIEVKRSLSPPRLTSGSRPPFAPAPLRTGSPLARLAGRSAQPPSSPLAQSPFDKESTPTPPSPTTTSRTGFLRHITSRSKLSEVAPSSPLMRRRAGTVSNNDLRSSASSLSTPPMVAPSPREITSPFPTQFTSSSPEATSPITKPTSPTLTRQSSLRNKHSLPNLPRINYSPERPSPENDTVQVQDMDFELVRPTFPHLQASRSSEDSNILGKDGAVDPRLDSARLTDSPTLSAPRSPGLLSDTNSVSSAPYTVAKTPDSPRPSDTEPSMDAHRQREQKWMTLMTATPPSQSRKSKKVKKLLLEGVPSSVRYLVWSHLTDGKARIVPGVYAQLGARARVPALGNIEYDVQRYLLEHPQLQVAQGPVLALLQAYLTMVPDIQYTTGLTLIAGHLLILAPEEDAFWIFVSVMDTHLRAYFGSSTTQIEVDSALFSRAVEASDSGVGKKLFVDLGISPVTICRPWFTSLFVGCLPANHLNRVWDIFLYEGVPFLLRVGLALVTCSRSQIMEATSETAILRILTQPTPNVLPPTPDSFVALAFSAKLRDDDVRKQRVKMEAQVKRQAQAPRPSGSISLPRI